MYRGDPRNKLAIFMKNIRKLTDCSL